MKQHSLTELRQTIEGASRKGAPLVFWDGYGLERTGSGIYVYAAAMASALAERQLYPGVISTHALSWAGPYWQLPGLPPKRLTNSKLVWPRRVAAILKQLPPRPVGRTILHGLSNLNLSKRHTDRYKTVLTVHDVIPLLAPDGVSTAYRWQFELGFAQALKAADRVVCVSPWTKRCIEERYPAFADKLTVIKNGMTLLPPKPIVPHAGLRLLTVARNESYKRLSLAVDLIKQGPPDWTMTMVSDPSGLAMAKAQAADLIQAGRLKIVSGLTLEQLGALYASADVLVHPSLFEGFGLPISESLAVGRPVVFVEGSAMDDIVHNDLAVRLRADATLAQWHEAIQRAHVRSLKDDFQAQLQAWRATQPTWKDAASQLETLYNGLQ